LLDENKTMGLVDTEVIKTDRENPIFKGCTPRALCAVIRGTSNRSFNKRVPPFYTVSRHRSSRRVKITTDMKEGRAMLFKPVTMTDPPKEARI
jgi:hypothetical protein